MIKSFISQISFLITILFLIVQPWLPAQENEAQDAGPIEGYADGFLYVRDNIKFEVYSGSLKGPQGVRIDRSGNSLDRALFLQELLKAKGLDPRIAHGRLFGANLNKVLANYLGPAFTGDITQLEFDPGQVEILKKDLADHYWVQISQGNDWLNLDPTLPDSVPGTTIANFRKQLKTVPSYLFQRLEISVFAEFSIGSQQARTRLLRYTATAKDLLSRSMTLMFLRRDLNGMYKYAEIGRFDPVLWVNGKIQPALNLQVEANRMALSSGGTVPPVEIHRLWIEYALKIPGQPDAKATRQLYSEKNPDTSRLNEITIISLFANSTQKERFYTYSSRLLENARTVEVIEKPSFPQVLSEREKNNFANLLSTQRDLGEALAFLLNSNISEAQKCVDISCSTETKIVKPQIMAVSLDPISTKIRTDILLFEPRPIAQGENNIRSIASGFAQGVCASALEGYLLSRLNSFSESSIRGSVETTNTINNLGIQWVAFDRNNIFDLDDYPLDLELKRRLSEVAENGKIVILPDLRGLDRIERDYLVWWELDSRNGVILGMIDPGIGGSELSVNMQETSWSTIASAYSPGFTEGWSKRLASFSRTSASIFNEGTEAWKKEEYLNIGNSIQLVYDIVYSAIAGNTRLEISPSLREYFGPIGRNINLEVLASICRSSESEILLPKLR